MHKYFLIRERREVYDVEQPEGEFSGGGQSSLIEHSRIKNLSGTPRSPEQEPGNIDSKPSSGRVTQHALGVNHVGLVLFPDSYFRERGVPVRKKIKITHNKKKKRRSEKGSGPFFFFFFFLSSLR